MLTTRIGKYEIPLSKRDPMLVKFSGGAHGKSEAGWFAFWTAVLKKPFTRKGMTREKKKSGAILGRAYIGLAAGELFERMREASRSDPDKDNRRIYRILYFGAMKAGRNVKTVRPSTIKEVKLWFKDHKEDAKHVVASLVEIK